VTLIAAADRNWGIGCRGAPLLRILADLRRFKALTMGHALLMGRKTFDSLPGLLPGRAHVVLSRDPDFAPPGVTVLRSLDEAREYARADEAFLIGGGEIYAALLEDCELAYITKIDVNGAADVFMPNLDETPRWRLAASGPWQEDSGIQFRYCVYEQQKSGCILSPLGI